MRSDKIPLNAFVRIVNMMDIDFPCVCGHLENVHPSNDDKLKQTYIVCDGCFQGNRIAGVKQLNSNDCWKYVPDNLRYLESLIE